MWNFLLTAIRIKGASMQSCVTEPTWKTEGGFILSHSRDRMTLKMALKMALKVALKMILKVMLKVMPKVILKMLISIYGLRVN